MKEATGELNMTVITLIAIGAIGALFYVFVWPMIQRTIAQQTCQTYGTNYDAVEAQGGTCPSSSTNGSCIPTATTTDKNTNEKVTQWCCCPKANN